MLGGLGIGGYWFALLALVVLVSPLVSPHRGWLSVLGSIGHMAGIPLIVHGGTSLSSRLAKSLRRIARRGATLTSHSALCCTRSVGTVLVSDLFILIVHLFGGDKWR